MKTLCRFLALAVFLMSTPCYAKRDGNDLYDWIQSLHRWESGRGQGGDEIMAANLIGFINGAVDYGRAADRFCPPPNVTTVQVVAIMEKSLNENPETRTFSAVVLIDGALGKAFPCKK